MPRYVRLVCIIPIELEQRAPEIVYILIVHTS